MFFDGAHLDNGDQVALFADQLEAGSLWFTGGFSAVGNVDLRYTRAGIVVDDPMDWPDTLDLEGLIYQDLQPYRKARGPEGRLAWLSRTGGEYRPQPYEQLAAYYRRLGHEDEARTVLVAKQRRRRRELGWRGRTLGWFLDAIVGYGYRPGRAFAWMLALWLLGSWYFAVNQPGLADPDVHVHYQPLLYAADLVLPVIGLGQESAWAPAGGEQAVATALILLGWVLATAVVAGVTRVLTRS